MRFLIVFFLCSIVTLSLINDASAVRFGGNRSFGMHHSSFSSLQSHSQSNKRSVYNRYRPAMGGLIVGALLAFLFFKNGIAASIFLALLFGVPILIYLKQRFFPTLPDGFDPKAFLQIAKSTFLRLQSAYDAKDMEFLTHFTLPIILVEIQKQLHARGDAPNHTEVSELFMKLTRVVEQGDTRVAGVHFTGTVIENGTKIKLSEIWYFQKLTHEPDWVVGGIQQVKK